MDVIKTNLGEIFRRDINWIGVVQDRGQWRSPAYAVRRTLFP
jgi:hypothetical protein